MGNKYFCVGDPTGAGFARTREGHVLKPSENRATNLPLRAVYGLLVLIGCILGLLSGQQTIGLLEMPKELAGKAELRCEAPGSGWKLPGLRLVSASTLDGD